MTRPKKHRKAGEQFRSLLEEKGFTAYRLSQDTGIDKGHLSRICDGQVCPKLPTLEKIAMAFSSKSGRPLEIELGELTNLFSQSCDLASGKEQTPDPLTKQTARDRTTNTSQDSAEVRPEVYIANNLPNRTYTAFIGREKEMALLLQRLSARYAAYQITVDGIGGLGKTALVLEAAHRCLKASCHPGAYSGIPTFEAIIWTSAKQQRLTYRGIYSVSRFQRTLRDIVREIASALKRFDILNAAFEDQLDLVRECLAAQRTLLILDNLETVEDREEVISFLDSLFTGIKVVITTRSRVVMYSHIRLECLPPQDGIPLIHHEAEGQGLTLSEEDAKALYEGTGGVPAAIVYSIGQLASGYLLKTVLERLTEAAKKGDIARFCFKGSVQPLREKPAHKLLMALAMFRKPPSVDTRDAIAWVAGLKENPIAVEDGLVELQQLSLVTLQKERYNLLALTREYALAELAAHPNFEREARERWLIWYLDLAEKYGGEEWKEWHILYDKLEEEWDNLLAVLEWCARQSIPRYEDINKLWQRVQYYASIYGYWNERLFWSEWLLQAAERRGDWKTAMKEMRDKGWALIWKGHPKQLEEADQLLERAWKLHERVKDFELAQEVACFNSVLCSRRQQYPQAHEWINIGEKLLKQANSEEPKRTRQLILILYYRAEIYYQNENYERAKELYQEVVERGQTIDWQRAVNYAQNWLADIAIEQGNLDEVQGLLDTGLREADRNKDKRRIAYYKRSFARFEQKLGNQEKAREWAVEALDAFDRLGMLPEAEEMRSVLLHL